MSYTVTGQGSLEARGASLSVVWSAQLSTSANFRGSPVLDCERDGMGAGVIYAASDSGDIVALLVDSPGLDPSAPWPKYQHDVRNTGNPTTPIQSCP